MKKIVYKITDALGWCFCEIAFRIWGSFPEKENIPVANFFYEKGTYFYSFNDE